LNFYSAIHVLTLGLGCKVHERRLIRLRKIILNQEFYINIKYLSYLNRPIDIYLQFYNNSNIVFLENKIEMTKQLGYVSIGNTINDTSLKNIKTEILITPKNEPKINLLNFKEFNLIVADKKNNNCKYFLYQGFTPLLVPSIDSVYLKSYETHLIYNSIIEINVQYNLVSLDIAQLNFYLMGKNNNNIINHGSSIIINRGLHDINGNITIPRAVIHSGIYTTVYVAVYMIPLNSSLISSIAEDKTYLLNFIN
jgi:hypothetical protein